MKNLWFLSLLCLPFIASAATNVEADDKLNTWLDNEFFEYLDFYPQSKRRYGIKEDYGELNDGSLEHQEKVLAWRRQSVAEMKRTFDRSELSSQGKISYDLWQFLLERSEAGVPYRYHPYIFGRRGPHTSLPRVLIGSHKVESKQDLEDYLSKLNQSARFLDQYLVRSMLSAKKGIRAPYFDSQIALRQSKKVIGGAPFAEGEDTAIWQDIQSEVDALLEKKLITKADAKMYRAAAKAALIDTMLPAYERIIAWLEAEALAASKNAKGASSLPNGDAYYQYALNRNTTLKLTADEIHNKGLSEVARIHKEMREIVRVVNFDGDLKDFFKHLRESDEFYFPSTDEGRQKYLDLANQYLDAMDKKLPEYFGVLPKMALEVKRVEAYREQAGGAAHYVRGIPNGGRPGVFYAHLVDMRAAAIYRLENLAYHEGLPGHHMQIAIQQEIEGLPRFRTHHGYTAFSEGWGLYSEFLAKEMGFYTNPYNNFGRLSGELWRSIRLVVDTGIHSKGWSEQQAIDYALNNSPYPAVKAKSEIRRYFNNPAQATAYKIGMLKIIELRRYAEAELGDKFDIRRFHDTVIGAGPLPLPILEQRIKDWVASEA